MAVNILNISKERWMMEMDKMLITDYVGKGLLLLWESGLFRYMIPELDLQFNYDQNSQYHNFKLHQHTIKVVESCPKDVMLRWTALLHDIAKPFVRTENKRGYSNYINHELLGAEMVNMIARNLKWSNERRKACVELVRTHLEEDCILRKYDNMAKKGEKQ